VCLNVQVYMWVRVCMCVHVCICVCVHVCACVCMCVCDHINTEREQEQSPYRLAHCHVSKHTQSSSWRALVTLGLGQLHQCAHTAAPGSPSRCTSLETMPCRIVLCVWQAIHRASGVYRTKRRTCGISHKRAENLAPHIPARIGALDPLQHGARL